MFHYQVLHILIISKPGKSLGSVDDMMIGRDYRFFHRFRTVTFGPLLHNGTRIKNSRICLFEDPDPPPPSKKGPVYIGPVLSVGSPSLCINADAVKAAIVLF